MKVGTTIFEKDDHKWIAVARDPDRPEHYIDTVEYLVMKNGKGCLLDPGGMEIFPSVFSVIGKEIEPENLEFIFSTHEDPDVISSLPLWISFKPSLVCYVSWIWGGFISHYGCDKDSLLLIPDDGMKVTLGGDLDLEFVPAHHLHASGNFHVYDEHAKILFTGDVGAALLPKGMEHSLFVEDFDKHVGYMKQFHQRWMPSNEAKNDWIDRVDKLEIDFLCPQHGSIMKGEDVKKFLGWFRELNVGHRALKLG